MDFVETLRVLCDIPALSGLESHTAGEMEKRLRPYCDKTHTDALGNVYGLLKCKKKNAKTVLLDAHLDQIGFLVTEVLTGGFVRFAPVGGVDPRMLLASEVTLLAEEPLHGVVCSTPPHLQKAGEENKAVPIEEMMIDTGLRDAAEKIKIGTPILFHAPFLQLNENSVTSKCLDDRAGIAAILYALEKLKGTEKRQVNVAVLISGQEEETGLGAQTGAFAVQPDAAIAVDVSHAKTPDAPSDGVFAFGDGSLIGMGPNLHRGLTERLIKTAKAEDIPYALEVMEGNTGTNAWTIQIVAHGIATALLSIPLRYMHTPIETIQLSDLEATGELLYRFLKTFDGEVSA